MAQLNLNKSMERDLNNLYNLTSDWMQEVGDITSHDIVDKAAELYVEYSDNLPNIIIDVCRECMFFMNMDFEEGTTFEDMCNMGGELAETLNGCLGEYFA